MRWYKYQPGFFRDPAPVADVLFFGRRPGMPPRPYPTLFDTGANLNLLTQELVKSLDLRPITWTNFDSPGGSAPTPIFKLDIEILGHRKRDVRFGVFPKKRPRHGQRTTPTPALALVGRDVLRDFALMFQGRKLVKQGEREEEQVLYIAKTANLFVRGCLGVMRMASSEGTERNRT